MIRYSAAIVVAAPNWARERSADALRAYWHPRGLRGARQEA
jgi:hypothetical protein